MTAPLTQAFAVDGVLVVERLIDEASAEQLAGVAGIVLDSAGSRRPGVRRALSRDPRLAAIAQTEALCELMTRLAGRGARIVRSILFDKTPQTNWAVPWHQDPTIAVTERIDAPGFGPWAIKEGEHHCQPPLAVLESIVTIRIHLDPCPADAGPLRVVRGSHRHGLLSEAECERLAREGDIVEAVTPAGGAAVMTPLSLHSSPRATMNSGRRRVLHLECTAMDLPHGLSWAEASDGR